jgi:hypothetical protein
MWGSVMTFWRRKELAAPPVEIGQSLFIKDLISKVHDELLQSRQAREQRGDPAIFEVENMTLEVNFVAQRDSEFNGGIDLKIVTVGGARLGGTRHYNNQQIHKITLMLTALPYQTEDAPLGLDHAPRFLPSED